MKSIFIAIIAALALASCSQSYSIKGTSDVTMLDGHMLYLKAVKGDQIKNIDSCDVVHGNFQFNGQYDTTTVAAIYINETNLMPVVLENGNIEIAINTGRQTCSGSPLNEKLSTFIEKYNQILTKLEDIEHNHYKAIMDGKDMEVESARNQQAAAKLMEEQEQIITSFIEENFDNVLGPFAFQMVTGSMQYPMYDSWIEALLSKATATFKNDPYVKDFVEAAERNRNIMNGMEEPASVVPAAPAQAPVPEAATPDVSAQIPTATNTGNE